MKQIRKIWDAVVKRLCSIELDTWLPFIVGVLVAVFFLVVLKVKVCIMPVIFLAFFKEMFDMLTTHKRDWKDFIASLIGGLIVQLFAVL